VIIGIDFDNTIASYDEPMHRTAVEQGLIPAALPKNKKLVRDAIRALEDGESKWRGLQVHSYGPGMPEARAMDGVKDFVGTCKQRGIPVRIVSHKTEFANFGAPGVNLREAALRWLESEGFVDSARHGVGRAHIYFEGTREEKIARIRALGITHFVDDLEETFLEESFPAGVQQILYAPHGEDSRAGRWRAFEDWPAIQRHLLGGPGAPGVPTEDLDALAVLIGRPVDSAERVGAGRNSRVYRVRAGGAEYAAKFYFKPTADGRDRLQVEFNALQFLWDRGLRDIAQPLRADGARQVALYQFLAGEPVDSAAVSAGDVDQLLSFVGALKKLGADAESAKIGSAAEAFFNAAGVVANVQQRLARLRALDAQGPGYDALRRFLREQFAPALRAWGERALAGAGGELEARYRTLSPSDLGFHNALRRPGGRLAFLDFEYFGWDDPAKTLSDCLLHPMMRLQPEHRQRLRAGFDAIFGADPRWQARVHALYPLFALKWCMILLNEFRTDQIERRRYVDRKAEEIQVIQMRQLDAARALLERTTREQGE
jgi:hypothetical protein